MSARCNHPDDQGCDRCDPPGRPSSIHGDTDHDFDARDARALAAYLDENRETADTYARF